MERAVAATIRVVAENENGNGSFVATLNPEVGHYSNSPSEPSIHNIFIFNLQFFIYVESVDIERISSTHERSVRWK